MNFNPSIMHKLLGSSIDPQKLALTVKGILVAIAPVVFLVARSAGFSFGEADYTAVINVIMDLIAQVGALAGTLMTIYGAIRKLWTWLKNRQNG